MTTTLPDSHRSLHRMRHRTGIVIPVYLPPGTENGPDAALLEETVATCCAHVAEPRAICLSVDGADYGADVAQRLSTRYGVSLSTVPDNRGKLWGAIHGVKALLDINDVTLDYIAVIDQDNDHFANEMLNFVRAADHMQAQTGDVRVLVLGRRISLHRPMGFLRGELEILADRVILDALHYRAAITGAPLRLEYASLFDSAPDFQSGYKLFSRATAEAVFDREAQLAGVSPTTYYRHACETVMVVEAIESGARLGVVNRSTFNEQPVTHFGKLNQGRATADMIIWACRRLDVPLPFVCQWIDNHSPRSLLTTIGPEGQTALAQIRRLVIEAYDSGQDNAAHAVRQPLFV